ncbi:hypothetical protein MA16_Dca007713 [Dendrobium catenatum]|uniref:Uncharacterized protein n=1 Tax=Dendrobium catenatum TaxID=906689 RepID=A0A2I0X565_9ASPA|nr:hypothetical protein MA16_Dca007713 [Dendrobium catenatum]
MYKEAIFSTNDLVGTLPNNIISLCSILKMSLSIRNIMIYLQFEELNIKFFFIVGASIPNRLAYRSNFMKNKELQLGMFIKV